MNLPAEQAKIRRSAALAGVFCAAVLGGTWFTVPAIVTLPAGLAERLAFAVQADLLIFLCLVIAVRMVSRGRFYSSADIGGAAAGPPRQALAIKVAFLQNTLEQAVLAVGVHLALATLLHGAALSLIIGAAILFAIGRACFYWRYPGGTGARAFGMVVTTLPTLVGFALAVVLLFARVL